MAESIETFVSKLRQDGVDAGKAEADKLVTEAEARAEKIRAAAEQEAERIRAEAEQEAEQTLAKGKADLALAVRDTVARLRAQLGAILSEILARRAQQSLADGETIAKAVVALLQGPAAAGIGSIEVPAELRDAVVERAVSELGQAVADGRATESLIQQGREQPGFAYSLEGGTVVVDASAVTEHLGGMVNPALRKIIAEARQDEDQDR